MTSFEYKIAYRKNLPHIQPPGATLFVTFRLAGSIPITQLNQLLVDKQKVEEELKKIDDDAQRFRRTYQEQKKLFAKWDSILDVSENGPHWLGETAIAQIVRDALHYLDGRVYELDTFCIMSNHVHSVYTPLGKTGGTYHPLAGIMHSLKRHTARQANKYLGREGRFWQHESYDHAVRDEAELRRIRRHVLNNPVKAGVIDDWKSLPWSFCRFQEL